MYGETYMTNLASVTTTTKCSQKKVGFGHSVVTIVTYFTGAAKKPYRP